MVKGLKHLQPRFKVPYFDYDMVNTLFHRNISHMGSFLNPYNLKFEQRHEDDSIYTLSWCRNNFVIRKYSDRICPWIPSFSLLWLCFYVFFENKVGVFKPNTPTLLECLFEGIQTGEPGSKLIFWPVGQLPGTDCAFLCVSILEQVFGSYSSIQTLEFFSHLLVAVNFGGEQLLYPTGSRSLIGPHHSSPIAHFW